MLINIHPVDPQPRNIKMAADILRKDGVLVYPTDSNYALCCMVGNQKGMERIIQIRAESKQVHYFSLVCRDLSELSQYALVDNRQYRLLRAVLPGAYTFILKGSREVPKRLLTPKRDTVGLRMPDHPITQALLDELGSPLMSATLKVPNMELYELNTPSLVDDVLGNRVDAVIDGGPCSMEPTTVIDLSDGMPEIIREGQGDVSLFI